MLVNVTGRRLASHSAPWMKGKAAKPYIKKKPAQPTSSHIGPVLLMTGTLGSSRSAKMARVDLPDAISNKNIKQMKCGFDHIIILHEDNTITSLGDNRKGQSFSSDPSLVGFCHFNATHEVDSISCGARYTFIYKKGTRSCRIAGHNEFHQLGIASVDDVVSDGKTSTFGIPWSPDIPSSEGGFEHISCGTNHTFVLMESGSVYAFGCNLDGQLGTGTTVSHNLPYPPKFWGAHQKSRPVTVCAGHGCSLFLCDDGKLFGCGKKDEGRIGLPWDPRKPVQLLPKQIPLNIPVDMFSVGLSHCTVVSKSGHWNVFGGSQKLGTAPAMIKDSADKETPLGLQAHARSAFKPDKVREVLLHPEGISGTTKVATLSSGKFHTVALTSSGEVWGTGWGGDFQLTSDNTDLPPDRRVLLHTNPHVVAAECTGSGTFIAINSKNDTPPSWEGLLSVSL
eukprot:TRINITY_DN3026_c1_g1_i1.p1 TRINITY_DN3026_c1_g1~~TRINITY_DN3026_c1_g1_i1.p1  ORF type:complete len:451 (+),score=59.77 TRINITY_DN3026_c1_g1_i1:101-1453(+)